MQVVALVGGFAGTRRLSSVARRDPGLRASLAAGPRAGRTFALRVSCNELNKWADRSNYDEHNDDEWEKSQFDQETAALVLKVLTAKATQRLILQLQELDVFKAQWLTNYCSENPPMKDKQFLLSLMKQPSSSVMDSTHATTHLIDPANLGHRIVQIRSEMAAGMVKFPKYVEVQSTEMLRTHLMSNTYVSGSAKAAGGERGDYKERRGYRRSRG